MPSSVEDLCIADCLTPIVAALYSIAAAICCCVAIERIDADAKNDRNKFTENPTVKTQIYSCNKVLL